MLEGGNDDPAQNVAAVLLEDNIIKRVVSYQIHAAMSARAGNGSPDVQPANPAKNERRIGVLISAYCAEIMLASCGE